jgi:uncharacterized protein
MKHKKINEANAQTFVLVFETGDEVIENLERFAAEKNLTSCFFTGIGAFRNAEVGYFDFSIKDYKKIPVTEQVEVIALNGNVVLYENKPKVHAHVILGRADGSTVGGHLLKAHVRPTLELILTPMSDSLTRKKNEEIGIPLIEL